VTSNRELLNLLEDKRQILIQVGLEKGVNSELTIKLSQELDVLINRVLKQTTS
jgi:hypothetical protein